MKFRFLFHTALLLSMIYLTSCSPVQENAGPVPVPKEIETGKSGTEDMDAAADSEHVSDTVKINEDPKVELDPESVLLQVINVNLDLDQTEEQIIVTKNKNADTEILFITVIDFDTVANNFLVAWKGQTQATNIKNFVLSFMDIVGDHKLEIVCSGIDEMGLRTLDIFRQSFSPRGIGLYYIPILNIKADGSIDIQELERYQAYKQGQSLGLSFPIITFSQNHFTENIMDLIRDEYYWNYTENKYMKGKTEYIPGRTIEEEQLRDLFTQDTEAFEDFLSGPWLKSDTSDGEGNTTIFFNSGEKKIIFYSEGIQEIYEWESSHRTRIPGSIYISISNQMVPFITKYGSVYVESLDFIRMEINNRDFTKSNSIWDGAYIRLGDSSQKEFITSSVPSHVQPQNVELTGEYKNSHMDYLVFNDPHIEARIDGKVFSGKYSVYSIMDDSLILDIKVMSKNKTLIDTRIFQLNHTIDTTDQLILYKLDLTAGEIGIRGFKPTEDYSKILFRHEKVPEPESGEM